MTDQPNALNHRDDGAMNDLLPPELVPVAERLTTDGIVWQTRLPDAVTVAERIRAIPAQSPLPTVTATREDHPMPTTTNPPALRPLPRPGAPTPPPGPAKRLFGLVAAIVLVALLATLFAQMANRGAKTTSPATSPTPTQAQPTPTETATPISTPTSTAPASTPTSASGGGPVPFSVTSVVAYTSGMTGTFPGGCTDPTFPYTVTGGIFTAEGAPAAGGPVTYQWVFSAGDPTPPITVNMPYQPNGNHGHTVQTTWNVPASAADPNVEQWVQLVVLAPNYIASPRVDFARFTCTFSVMSVAATASQINYDCKGPDAQTFTVAGQINTTYSPGGMITYHWVRPDGTVLPTQTIQVPGGADTVTVSPDSFTLTQANLVPHQIARYTERLVISAPTSMEGETTVFAGPCGS